MTPATLTPLDLGSLTRFLHERELCAGALEVQRIGDGHSNLTYRVDDGERAVVVRRPPPPPLPRGAHDVLREARIIGALEGTGVPVPRVLATARPGEVFDDVPCFVMELVDGDVITDATPGALATDAGRQGIAEQLVDVLVALHAVDWRDAGLEGLGRPAGANARALERMGALVGELEAPAPPAFAAVGAWLAATVPAEAGATIVHGDLRLGNVIFARAAPPRIAAVLDWELTTLGDPLADVGYLLACYAEPGVALHPVSDLGRASLEPGYPSRDALAARYAAATGRSLQQLRWYTAMNLWKLAALYEYSRQRGEDAYYDDPTQVERFLESALAAIAADDAR